MARPRQKDPLERLVPEDFESIAEMEAEARAGREGEPHGDDSLMERFDRWDLRRFTAWDSIKAVALTTVLLLIFAGGSVRKAANELDPGLGRDIVKAVGEPAGWVSDRLPLADTRRDLTSWLSPDEQLSGTGFEAGGVSPGRAAPVTPPPPSSPQPLHRLLITGDSLSTPLDIEIARELADQGGGVQVTRDPHLATGISNSGLVDWSQLSSTQAANDDPDAVVLFIGANEGYPMPGANGAQVSCCGPQWEAIFRSRVGQMMDNYLQGGGVQVTRDPHLATGISNSGLVDWSQLSSTQAANDDPNAVVLFIGANEGYPMPGANGAQVSCCGPQWEAIFRSRVGQMMDNYLEGEVERIYWLTIPTQRDPARKPIADAVNEAIEQAATERGPAVRVVDLRPTFTPGDSYRDAIPIDGRQTIVRESDGIHLNEDGSALAAELVLQAVDKDFDY